MTQTLPVVAKQFSVNEQTLARFRETLSPADQQVLEGLLDSIQVYNMTVSKAASHAQPMELLLLTMFIEHHKTLQFLIEQLNFYQQKLYLRHVKQSSGELEKGTKQ